MEAQGVEILTCGTCLNFYGLAEKLAVGGVTNMYAIVEALANAGKVINHDLPDNAATTRPKPSRSWQEAVAAAMNDYGNSAGAPIRRPWRRPGASTAFVRRWRLSSAVPGRTVWPSRPIPPWR